METPTAVDNTKTFELARKVQIVLADTKGQPNAIKADSSGNLPGSIELLKVGMWRTPYHGDIMVTPEDLADYVSNFNAGEARSRKEDGDYLGLPINFGHDQGGKAAGWMTELFVDNDTLMANVQWTDAGKEALLSGEWKCISPEFNPKGRGGWPDPLDNDRFVDNVLEGAGLTNIPLFRGLKPIMASASFSKNDEKTEVFLIQASELKEKNTMNLAEIRAKDSSALSDAEKDFLAQNKDQLTADEKTKFGFEVSQETTTEQTTTNTSETTTETEEEQTVASTTQLPEAVAASVASGKSVVIEADRLKRLEDTASSYEREKAEQVVKAHIARGAVKADALKTWTDKVMADASVKDLLDTLPDNPALSNEQGSDKQAENTDGSAVQKILASANKLVEADKTMDIGSAISKVRQENPELALEADREAAIN